MGDIKLIADYYNNISPDVVDRFHDELETALKQLLLQPAIGSLRYAHLYQGRVLRCWRLRRFLYRLFYRLSEHWVLLMRVLHEKRNICDDMLDG